MGRDEAISGPVGHSWPVEPGEACLATNAPTSTYRVQLSGAFTFRDAAGLVPYLSELGVGALYTSPVFKAAPGSSHGYDVTDYAAFNPEIGSEEDFVALSDALQARGLGLIVDFVPNHMGIAGGANAWWYDLLENGECSPYATFFDVDWRPQKRELHGKVLLPILGEQYGAVLERGELRLDFDDGAFFISYFDTRLPIAPPTYPRLLRHRLDDLVAELPADDGGLLELRSIVIALERLPCPGDLSPDAIAVRQREQVVAKRRLAELVRTSPLIATAIKRTLREFNGVPGEPRSFDLLDDLLAAQPYRLSFWRVAAEEINYRRFFAINELAAIHQEVPKVFAATHAFLLSLLAEGRVTGVRVDHPDGLWDPAGYFRSLKEAYRKAVAASGGDGKSGAGSDVAVPKAPLYVVVEKIVEPGEALPEDWAIAGTVGYEFATAVNGIFVDGVNRRAFDELYGSFVGQRPNFGDVVYESRYLMMRTALVSEINVLAQALNRISEGDRHTRDFTLLTLRNALREVIANFPVYRTYIVCEPDGLLERDRRYVETAIAQSRRRNPRIDGSVLDFVRDVLLSVPGGEDADEAIEERCRFSMKLQQLTGPVMAKGLEDTAFYRYLRLVSLNEVGGDPAQFGTTVAAFHRQNAHRRRRWPDAMLTTSTHDAKRSEDVRARIDVLSEIPRDWRAAINRWARLNRPHRSRVGGRPAPDRNDEYLLYQTLLGSWPVDDDAPPPSDYVERIVAYMEKATREAQVLTNWTTPNLDYEAATERFVRAILDPATASNFLADFGELGRRVAHFGAFNSLSQQVLKLVSPGVPDIYQGTELWDLSLVDPDNRRPVDFGRRAKLLRALRRRPVSTRLARQLVEQKADGRIKLFVTQRALDCRRARPELFARGEYVPLEAHGAASDHVCAFARRLVDRDGDTVEVVVAVPRLVVGVCRGREVAPLGPDVWGATSLVLPEVEPGTRYRNAFTGEVATVAVKDGTARLRLAELFRSFPVALLERQAGE